MKSLNFTIKSTPARLFQRREKAPQPPEGGVNEKSPLGDLGAQIKVLPLKKGVRGIFSAILIFAFLFLNSSVASAYTLLQPLPSPGGNTFAESIQQESSPFGPQGQGSFSSYLSWWFKFGLAAAALLAVVQIVIAGVQLIIGGANEGTISNAWGRVQDALWGVTLAFGAWLLLSLISPQFVSMQLTIPPIVVDKSLLTGPVPTTKVVDTKIYSWWNDTENKGCSTFGADLQSATGGADGCKGVGLPQPANYASGICCVRDKKSSELVANYNIYDFGTVDQNKEYLATIKITNTEQTPILANSVSLTSADSANIFYVSDDKCSGKTLNVQEFCEIKVGLKAVGNLAGKYESKVSVMSGGGTVSTSLRANVKVAIIGNSTGGGTIPTISGGTYTWENGDPWSFSMTHRVDILVTCEELNTAWQTKPNTDCQAKLGNPPSYRGTGGDGFDFNGKPTDICCLLPK